MRLRFLLVVGGILCSLLVAGASRGEDLPPDPARILKELREIRKSTDWNNPESRKKAKERSDQLMLQLEKAKQKKEAAAEGRDIDKEDYKPVMTQETAYKQAREDVAAGLSNGFNMGKPLHDYLIEAYKDDNSPERGSAAWFQHATLLYIDFSLPSAEALIGVMDKFQSIRVLVLTGGKDGAPPGDLAVVFSKAKNYPLEELHIINFRAHLSSIPPAAWNFSGLNRLDLSNNNVSALPPAVGGLKGLTGLYVGRNPISTVLPVVKELRRLKELGVFRTKIDAAELVRLEKELPGCKVLNP